MNCTCLIWAVFPLALLLPEEIWSLRHRLNIYWRGSSMILAEHPKRWLRQSVQEQLFIELVSSNQRVNDQCEDVGNLSKIIRYDIMTKNFGGTT